MTAQSARGYKPNPHNFEVAFERIGLPRERILHVAQSLFHDHVPAKKLGLDDGLDRPPCRPTRVRGDTAGQGQAGRDLPGHGVVRRGGDRDLRAS